MSISPVSLKAFKVVWTDIGWVWAYVDMRTEAIESTFIAVTQVDMTPLRPFAGVALLISMLSNCYTNAYLPSQSLVLNGLSLLGLQLFIWFIWRCIIYPKHFSPLRSIPTPPVGQFFICFVKEIGIDHGREQISSWDIEGKC